MGVYVNHHHHHHPHRSKRSFRVNYIPSVRYVQHMHHLIQQIPNTKASTPILIQGPVLFAVLEGVADPDDPTVAVPVADGVAREVAVPRTPLRVASPPAAACEADENLYISSMTLMVTYA